jgi:hypothetical protein
MKCGMRPLVPFAAALLAICWLSSCTKKSDARSAGQTSASTSEASDSLGKASFSAVVDGLTVSGGAIDGLQQANAAHIVPDANGGEPTLRFWLFDTKTPDEKDVAHSFRIEVPDKMGANPASHMYAHILLSNGTRAQYYSKEAEVTITSISSSRVTGTFSGKFSVPHDTPNVPKTEIVITDGKVDIPLATLKVYPN